MKAADYVPVTAASQLQTGKKYLFVGKYKTSSMPNPRWATVKDYNASKYFNSVDVTTAEADNALGIKISDPEGVMTFTLGGEEGAWTFLGSDGMYMNLTNTSNQVHQAAAVENDNQKWTVAFEDGAVALVKNKALTARMLWPNINSTRFACYGNKQSSNTLYLFVEDGGGGDTPTFRDIKADLTQLQALATGSNVYIKVSETGEISQAASAEEANATLKGNWHSSNYGWSNFTASVPVQGCAKITYATHDYGNDIVVTNTAGDEVAKFNTKGPKWENDKVNNVVVAYYRTNETTTLNFSNANYNPYFAVEAIDPGDLPAEVTKYNITFAAGEGAGNAPAALEIEDGQTFKAPKNYFLYAEGKTLTGWNDGTTTYAVGDVITPAADMTLTAQFTANTVALADRTAPVTISYDLSGYNDVGTYNYQGNSGIMVTQATVNGQSIDVKADVDATSGKFAYNGSGWHQVNNGTKVTVPSCKGAQFEVATYSKPGAVYFNGSAEGVVTTENNSATYTATGEAASIEISQNDNDYWQLISIILPVTGGGGDNPVAEDVTATWDYGNADVMDATMALSGATEEGKVDCAEKNGVQMTVLANGASFRNNGNNIQVRKGAEFRIPVKTAGDLVTITGYPGYSYYTINGGAEITNTQDNPKTEYKAKGSDVEKGYVSIVSTNDNNYFLSLSVVQYAPKEPTTLVDEAATVTFPFNEGTEGQKATFSNPAYFLNSKVTYGSNLTLKDKYTLKDADTDTNVDQTRFEPATKLDTPDEASAVRFTFNPLPGFTFKPTKVSVNVTRYGTDNGLMDVEWEVAKADNIVLATGVKPARNNGKPNISKLSYDIADGPALEGPQTLLLHLYSLQENKQFGLNDIVIEGVLNGTEKEVPVLASFKVNDNTYTAEDVFGDNYEATLELPKAEAMVSSTNPLTEVTPSKGEVGTITYEGTDTKCLVTIPMTAGETQMDYVLNVVFKPDFTLSYLDVEGNVLTTQLVEKDKTIGEFAYDINSVPATKDGYKARGWFKTAVLGEKFTTDQVITADTKLYAIQTKIEEVSTHDKYTFDLTDKFFYAEDHEAFVPKGEGFYYHDAQHGWAFKTGNSVDLLVGPKAVVSVTLCRYGTADETVITENGNEIGRIPGKNNTDTDGEIVAFNYEGTGGTITLNFNTTGEMYIHAVKIANIAETNYDKQGNWYFVKAGDAGSFLDVLDVVNGTNASADAERAYIFLPNGTYDLDATVKTAISGKNISIIGESMEGTIITTKPDISIEGLGKADMFQASSQNLYLQDLTLQNALDYYNAGSAGRAAVLQDAGTKTIGKNITMLSYQDTYYSSNNSQYAYWETCDIHGTVDFICGGGNIRFQNTTLTLEKRQVSTDPAKDGKGGRTITAPTSTTDFGYVFDGCKVVDLSEGKGDWNFGRTWQNQPVCMYLNTTLDDVAKNTLISTRWIEKGMNNTDPKWFGEYGTKDAAGTDITPTSNIIHSFGGDFETIKTANEALGFSYQTMVEAYTGWQGWDPAALAKQLEAPIATFSNGVVTITPADNGAIAYLIEKNGEFLAFTTEFTVNVEVDPEKDNLTIRAANTMGGFGEAKHIEGTTGIEKVTNSQMQNGELVIYNLSGQRFSKATKGLYIINGKKVLVK